MKVIATLAWKGGVGKSTLTINLATAAIEDGYKVGIIDLERFGLARNQVF